MLAERLHSAWEARDKLLKVSTAPFNQYDTVEKAGEVALGSALIKQKKAACLIVAGGQGTRLGIQGPKGCVEVLPGKSLFQIFADKIKAAEDSLSVAIMTSEENHAETIDFFEKHRYFGLEPSQIDFFSQSQFPFYDDHGNPIIDENGKMISGPSGNGASLLHLVESGIWEKWNKRGVEYFTFVQVDNPLADPFDPKFLGYHQKQKAEVTLKAILRDDPLEKVGVIVLKEGKVGVVEYNEMAEKERLAKDSNGQLLYPCANLSLFCFSMDFIHRLWKEKAWDKMPLHVAHKKVPKLNKSMGYKFEYFIFDVLPYSQQTKVIVYPRDQCYAPIKELKDIKIVKDKLLAHKDKGQRPLGQRGL